jgi:hypothetical protein
MKVNRQHKVITPTTAIEVFDIWADPSSMDYTSGGSMCANFAAQRYADVTYEEAKSWSLEFVKSGHEEMFAQLNDAYDMFTSYSLLYGQDDQDEEGRPVRPAENAILRVAQAFAKNPENYRVIVDENEDGMLFVELTNAKQNRFAFTILEDYEIFWAFYKWRETNWALQKAAAKKASADRFLEDLKD